MIKLVSKKEELKTALMVGSRVTFIGNLPGGHYDNYSGYTKVGSMYGIITTTLIDWATVAQTINSQL